MLCNKIHYVMSSSSLAQGTSNYEVHYARQQKSVNVLAHKGHATKSVKMNSNKQNTIPSLECLDYAQSFEKLQCLVESVRNGQRQP